MGIRIAWNILALLAGIFLGSVVNIMLVNIGPVIIPLPEGADVSSIEGVKESMKLFTPMNFLFPFLGHAIGTLFGALVAARLAACRNLRVALGVGLFFLLGGIAANSMIGGPVWFQVADLALAYIPMAYLGASLAGASKPRKV